MRKYEGMRLPPGVDKALRKELLKPDRFLKQVQAALSKSLTKTNLPEAVIQVGSPGVPGGGGNMPDHNHSAPGLGGKILGTSASTITAKGLWNFSDGIGIGAVQTSRIFLNLVKTYDAPTSGATYGLKTAVTYTNNNSGFAIMSPHELTTITQTTDNSAPASEIRNFFSQLKITNTVDTTGQTLYTNTSYTIDLLGTTQNLQQLIGNRINVLGLNAGNLAKFEAYVMDNNWNLATGKQIQEFIVYSCPSPKVMGGLGILDFYGLKIDAQGGGTVTNRWGWHVGGSTTKSYHQGKIGINQTSPGAMLEVDSDAAATKAVLAKAAASQSANIVEVQDSSANVLGSWDKDGQVRGTLSGSIRNKPATLVLAAVDLLAQTAGSGSFVSIISPTTGFYRASLYAATTTTGTAGAALSVSIQFNDGNSTQDTPFWDPVWAYTMDGSVANSIMQGTIVFYAAAGTDIKYKTFITATGNPQFTVRIRLEGLYS